MPTKFEVSFTRKAEQDIEDIWSFIAEDSPDDATSFIQQLEKQNCYSRTLSRKMLPDL
jgi:plasmid stabilization system protein ParE